LQPLKHKQQELIHRIKVGKPLIKVGHKNTPD
jgi:hypothetical protein